MPGFHLIDNESLAEEANHMRMRARSRPPTLQDQFLVISLDRKPESGKDSGVVPISGAMEARLLNRVEREQAKLKQAGRSAKQALDVFLLQRPHKSISFRLDTSVGECSHARLLPNHVSLVDHLAVQLRDTPDWERYAQIAEGLRKLRVPRLKEIPAPTEILVGVTPDSDIDLAIVELECQRAAIDRYFGMCLFALDTEAITVKAGREGALYRDGEFFLVPTKRGEKGGRPFAIRLMVGHVDWHLHITLPFRAGHCSDLGDVLGFRPGTLQSGLTRLFQAFEMVCGVRVLECAGMCLTT